MTSRPEHDTAASRPQRWTATDEYDNRVSYGYVPKTGSLAATLADLRRAGIKHYKPTDSNYYVMVHCSSTGYVQMSLAEATAYAADDEPRTVEPAGDYARAGR